MPKSFAKSLFYTVGCIAALAQSPALAQSKDNQLGIVTGSQTGTYIKFGKDLRKLLIIKRKKINLKVHTSVGSLENVYDVYKSPKAQLGIVQSDVLAFIETRDDADMQKIAKKVRLVHPLYNEEVHILANSSVESFDDLDGRRVAIGLGGSGTNLTATTLLSLGGVGVEPVHTGGQDALDALKAGKIDAMFYVAGLPVKLFSDQVSKADGLKFLSIENEGVTSVYNVNSTITKDTYDFVTDDVNTVAVKAVLVTYDYQKGNCGLVGDVGNAVIDEIDWLRNNGHPKWKEVDLSYQLAGWTQYECVKKAAKKKKPESKEFDKFLEKVKKQ
ncbi:TAXI family TRAP transporter solute-binding subunit [Amylibacter marinus]|nr:TAXI family TRAP transporter solute-binding subunit [Amylibacter marinus]